MTQFHNVGSITQKDKMSSLEDNIKSFLDWSFLNIGGFINVNIPTPAITGSAGFHSLKLSTDPTVTGNRLWQAIRKDWVYESGVNYNGSYPIAFSGLYLNSTFLPAPSGSGNYGYSVNYPMGQIQFNNAVSSTSTVNAAYSYRYVQTYKISDATWWKEVQRETYIPANYKPNGDYAITTNNRVQLPAIVIELAPKVDLIPHELGTTRNIIKQDVFLHIFSSTANQRNILVDILLSQKDKTLYLYDPDKVAKNQAYSLMPNGSLNLNGKNYPTLISNFKHYWCTINNSSIGELNTLSSNLYNGIVRWSIEIFP